MAVAPSQTRIVNHALALLGSAQRISHINDGSGPAELALALWDEVRDELLADHPYNFSIGRANLPASSTPPEFGYARAFELPADCLRWLPPEPGDPYYFRGVREGDVILSDAEAPIYIRYIRRIEDMGRWSPGFILSMGGALAEAMALAMTAMEGISVKMERRIAEVRKRGRRQDALESGDRDQAPERRSNWLAAREQGFA